MREIIYPVKVVCATSNVNNTDALFLESYPQIDLNEKSLCEMPENSYLILDFGKEFCGGVRLLAFTGSEKVRIRVGESVGEACAELGEKHACNDHSLRDLTVPVPAYSDNEYIKSGFRFLRIDNLGQSTLKLKKVFLIAVGADLEQKGSFVCNDERVNEIFNVGARTLYLNAQNGVLYDGIKRDRLVWVGDLHPEFLAFTGLYDDYKYLRNCLEFCIEQTPLPLWMNNIKSYTMWFVLNVRDYILHSGDVEFLHKYKDYIYKTLLQICTCIGDDGKLKMPTYFLDWQSKEFPDQGESGVAGLCKLSLDYGCEILFKLGYDLSAIQAKIRLLTVAYGTPCDYKQGAAIRAFSGLNQDAEVIIKDGAKGFSTFMSYYLLRAVASEYGTEKATELMKEYYGGMLDLGATTFFEDFDLEWLKCAGRIDEMPTNSKKDVHGDYGKFCYKGYRHSLCHGWASGVVQYLQREVAGIKVLENGCSAISIKPNAGKLEWFKATFPTPKGIVKVEYDGREYKTQVPEGIRLV